jgi:5'-nucleotidase
MKHSRRCVKELKDMGCEVIVALTHVSLHTDKSLAEIPGIDVIIGGHEHTPYLFMQKETMIVKCGQNVDHLGIMDLNFERDELHNLILIPSFHLLSTKCAKTDPAIDAIISKWNDIVDPDDQVLTCVGEVALSTLTADCRCTETAFPCMVADAIKHSYRGEKCHLAIQNGGFIRCDNVYPPNSLLYKSQVLNEMPFPRKAVLLKMKGKDIKLGLEQMITKCPEPVGCFPHLSHGWRVEYDLSRPPLDRIVSLCYKRHPIDMDDTFHVCIQDFYIDRDGDGVDVFADMEILAQHGKLVSECVVEYLPSVPYLSGEPPGRFVPKTDDSNNLFAIPEEEGVGDGSPITRRMSVMSTNIINTY